MIIPSKDDAFSDMFLFGSRLVIRGRLLDVQGKFILCLVFVHRSGWQMIFEPWPGSAREREARDRTHRESVRWESVEKMIRQAPIYMAGGDDVDFVTD